MSDSDRDPPVLSVIIPVLNEALTIQDTLRSTGSDPAVEVIVVDGGSRDQTADIVRRAGATLLCCAPGRARQLNRGAARARGEVFLFTRRHQIAARFCPQRAGNRGPARGCGRRFPACH